MRTIQLPISKSIAARILLLQAIHGDELMPVAVGMPDDVKVLHDALVQIRAHFGTPQNRKSNASTLSIYLKNCGTALRFLEVHLATCYPDAPITLTGDERLLARRGKPTSQTTSARILHGESIPFDPNESPYITMSRKITASYNESVSSRTRDRGICSLLEPCWSSAAFWYEYVAIHGGEILLKDLRADSIQGDRVVADIYASHFGVKTTFTSLGAIIQAANRSYDTAESTTSNETTQQLLNIDFTNCPDLYPAIALTCERLNITLHATGTERLKYKESDRIEAVGRHEVRNDHRIAMAMLAADYPVSIADQACISKSYPSFVPQHITPIRGVNDDNKGKKYALSRLIHAATSDYLWLHDDDIVLPPAAQSLSPLVDHSIAAHSSEGSADLYILPLRMESLNTHPSLLERLQIVEYAAIQELTMRTAKAGKAVMCSGANLIVRRETWLSCESDIHPELPSGDDMFLLESAKRRGFTVRTIDTPDFTAVVRPQTSWRAFFRQRMRWAGKAPHYTDHDILRCGTLVLLANIAQFLFPPLLIFKFPFEYALIRSRLSSSNPAHSSSNPAHSSSNPAHLSSNPTLSYSNSALSSSNPNHSSTNSSTSQVVRHLFAVSLLLELCYPYYLVLSLLGGLFNSLFRTRQSW